MVTADVNVEVFNYNVKLSYDGLKDQGYFCDKIMSNLFMGYKVVQGK